MAGLVLFQLAKDWYTNSAYMNRPPEVDFETIRPGGIRTANFVDLGVYIKVPEYKAAGMDSLELAKNLDVIVKILGLEYLRNLKKIWGQDDGYSDWFESPFDVENLKRTSVLNAAVLTSLAANCADYSEKDQRYCIAFRKMRLEPGYFIAYGEGRIAVLDTQGRYIHIAYAGPHTGSRR